jgi:Raf kinase inhibitor-like YbhB/YbcL family protein
LNGGQGFRKEALSSLLSNPNELHVMKLTSPAFADKIPVPVKYTCKGPNISPPLEFIDVPKNAKSLVLIVEDIDSTNHWIHWLVYNIPGDTTHFEEGKIAKGAIDGVCNGGTHGYEGPCPKYFSGIHRYCFRLFALDTTLEVPLIADANVIRSEMEGHILATAELLGVAEGEQVSQSVS